MTSPNSNAPRATLPSSERSLPLHTASTGPTLPGEIITVSVITRRKNPLHLHALGGRILSHAEFNEEYAADPADFESLRTFAHEHGLAVDEAASSLPRRTLVLRGTAKAMEAAFGVTLHNYQHLKGNHHYRSFTGSITVPAAHAEQIQAVLGLDNRPIATPHYRRLAGTAHAAEQSFSPVQVAALYDFPADTNGAGQTIGIIELGGGYEASDITEFFGSLNLTPPSVVAVSVDGATNSPGDPNGADGEVALDIQVAGAIAPGAKIAVYFTTNTDQGFTDAITTAVHDTANKPSVISISWGGPESSWTADALTAMDNACQSAGALGVTITVASGDSGSTDGGTGKNVDFPASSPHVLGCGGTQLEGSGTTISNEQVWDDQPSGGGASGGGVSTVFALPTWQANAKVPAAASSTGGRGVPDVAGDASPETGYNILVDGTQQTVGGTSAVAPLWAALLARVNQQRVAAGGTTVGFVNPTLYTNTSAFHDITEGNNGSFQAGKGWDACTGLGSPNGTAIAAALAVTSSGTGGTNPVTPPAPVDPAPPVTPAPKPPKPTKHKHHHPTHC
jgi:kumamolisin